MKRARLDVGALASVNGKNNNFVFFLCKKGSNEGIPIELSPNQIYTVLTNFDKVPEKNITSQQLITNILGRFNIELLEVEIKRDREANIFVSKLLLFNGEVEIVDVASAVDGAILAKKFEAPIYISNEELAEFAVDICLHTNSEKDDVDLLLEDLITLESKLKEAIDNEEYEKAAKIKEELNKRNIKK